MTDYGFRIISLNSQIHKYFFILFSDFQACLPPYLIFYLLRDHACSGLPVRHSPVIFRLSQNFILASLCFRIKSIKGSSVWLSGSVHVKTSCLLLKHSAHTAMILLVTWFGHGRYKLITGAANLCRYRSHSVALYIREVVLVYCSNGRLERVWLLFL